MFRVGDKVAAPVCKVFKDRKPARSKYGYDIGTVVATGRNKKTGKPAVKVRIETQGSVWAKRISKEPFIEKWCLAKNVDKV